MTGEGEIPETYVKVIIMGKDQDGNYVPIQVDAEGRMVNATEEEEEEEPQQM